MSVIDTIMEEASKEWTEEQILDALGGPETIRHYFDQYFKAVKAEVGDRGISDAEIAAWMKRNRDRLVQEYIKEWQAAVAPESVEG
jgi:hypothetical protein